MKLSVILLSTIFLFSACKDVEKLDDQNSDTIEPFAQVKDLLFKYEVKSENKYLVINNIDDINNRITIETYILKPSSNSKTRREEFLFICATKVCKTTSFNNSYDEIKVINNNKKIIINRFTLDVRNDKWTPRSSYQYDAVE